MSEYDQRAEGIHGFDVVTQANSPASPAKGHYHHLLPLGEAQFSAASEAGDDLPESTTTQDFPGRFASVTVVLGTVLAYYSEAQ